MKKVLLIDSGSGGINILKECIKICPHCDFLFFCDNKNLPYGEKSKQELLNITIKNLESISKFFDYEIVVFACNTLTSTCIAECRERFKNIKFVGTEPAVAMALKRFEAKDILVLGTKATIENNKLLQNNDLNLLSMSTLASLIDENLYDLSVLRPILLESLKNTSAKAVVLGCTHYVAVKNILKTILPQNTEIFDSANGVARRLRQFVNDGDVSFKMQIMASKEGVMRDKLLWYYFNS